VAVTEGVLWDCAIAGLKSGNGGCPRRTETGTYRRCIWARQGVITERWSTLRSAEAGTGADRSEVARGRCIIPQHPSPQPSADGHWHRHEVQDQREHRELLHQLEYRRGAEEAASRRALWRGHRHGSSTGGDIPTIRKAIIDASPVPGARCRCMKRFLACEGRRIDVSN